MNPSSPLFHSAYASPLGTILLTSDAYALLSLRFAEDADLAITNCDARAPLPIKHTKDWLNLYFSGHYPGPLPPCRLLASPFQIEVLTALSQVSFGHTVTYGALAASIAHARGQASLSPRAVGHALSQNPLPLLFPCHRVIATGNRIGGYAYGTWRKEALLALEGILLSAK